MTRHRIAVLGMACLGLILAPGSRSSAQTAPASSEYANTIEKMLAESSVLIPARIERAGLLYQQALATRRDDPWLDYAYALVLLQMKKHDDGILALNAAIHKGLRNDLSLQRLLIRSRCANGSLEPDLASLSRYATMLEAEGQSAANAVERMEGALFLGRLVGYLTGPGTRTAGPEELINAVDRQLQLQLSEPLRKEYENGKADVERRYEELRSTAVEAHREQQAKVRADLVNRSEQLKQDAEAAGNELLVGGQQAQQRIAALNQDIAMAKASSKAIQQQIHAVRQNPSRVSTTTLERQRSAFDARVRKAQCEIQRLSRYCKELVRRHDRLVKAQLRSDRQLSQGNTSEVSGQAQRELRNLDTYIPLDYQRECQRVLENARRDESSRSTQTAG